MSYPWPSDLHRQRQTVVPSMAGQKLHFESLESRILLSAEIGVPPNDPFADELSKDRFATLEARYVDASRVPAAVVNEQLQASIVSALEQSDKQVGNVTPDIPESWVLPYVDLLGPVVGDPELPNAANDGLPVELSQSTANVGGQEDGTNAHDPLAWPAQSWLVDSTDADSQKSSIQQSKMTPVIHDAGIVVHTGAQESGSQDAKEPVMSPPVSSNDAGNGQADTQLAKMTPVIRDAGVAVDAAGTDVGSQDAGEPARQAVPTWLGGSDSADERTSLNLAKMTPVIYAAGAQVDSNSRNPVQSSETVADSRTRTSSRALAVLDRADLWVGNGSFDRPLTDMRMQPGEVQRMSNRIADASNSGAGTASGITPDGSIDMGSFYGQSDFLSGLTDKNGNMPGVENDEVPMFYGRPDYLSPLYAGDTTKGGNGSSDTVTFQAFIPGPTADGDVVGTPESDTFENSTNASNFQGLAGNDIYLFDNTSGTDTVEENPDEGEDTLDFSAVTTNLTFTFNGDGSIDISGAGIDVTGVTNVEILIGGQGDDNFNFLAGSQFLGTIVGGGETLTGDTLNYSNYSTGVTVDLGAGTAMDTAAPPDEFLTVSGIENVTGSAFADVLTGDSQDNEIVGGAGNDTLIGGAGDDTLTGGADTNTVSYADANAGVTVDLSIVGAAQDTGGAGMDTLSGIQNVTGSDYDDTLSGDGGANVLVGGAGTDTVSYADVAAGMGNEIFVNLGTIVAQDTVGDGTDTLSEFENIIGSDNDDTLTGDGGDNVIVGGLGNDILTGGGGIDTVSYAGAAARVWVDLVAGTGTTDTNNNDVEDPGAPMNPDEQDALTDIDNIIGSGFDDVLSGDAQANAISGGAGADTLSGGGGDDTLQGGDGIEIDTLSYASALAGVTVDLSDSDAQGTGGAGSDTISGFENLTGSAFDDTLSGDAGNNVLDGGGGSDTISYANATEGIVAALGIAGPQDTMGAGDDTLLNFANLTGSEFDDTLTGDGFANVIDGGAGDDTLIGGAGDDDLTGGDGSDTVSYAGSTDTVWIDLLAGTGTVDTNMDDIENPGPAVTDDEQDTLATIENVIGGSDDDFITGDGQANVIAGGAGNDTLTGGGGIDTVSYADAPARIWVDLAAGTGTVDTNGDDVENPGPAVTDDEQDTLTGFDNIIGTGYGLGDPLRFGQGDTLTGTAGDNQFFVAAGADATISGGGPGPDNDSLVVDGRGLELTGSTATTLTFDTIPATTPTTITYNDIEDVRVENAAYDVDVDLLLQGLRALADRFEELERATAFVEAIPLADPLGATFGDLQNFGRVLRELVQDIDDNFGATASAGAISGYLSSWAIADLTAGETADESVAGTVSWVSTTLAASHEIVIDATGDVSQVIFGHNFTSDRTSRFDLSLSDTLRDADVAVARETFFNFLSGFQLDFTFGLTGLGATPDFFVDEGMQLLSNAALPGGLPVDVIADSLIGFMGGTIDGPINTLTAAADGFFAVTDGIRTLAELQVPDSIGVQNIASTIDAALDFVTAPGFTVADLGDGLVDFANSDFLNLGTVLDLPGESADFGLISPNELLRMLDQLGGWLATLAQSEILDMQVPFVGNTTVGDLLDYGEAFGEELLRFLVRHDGLTLSGDALNLGRLPAGNPLTFNLDVETGSVTETYTVELDPFMTLSNTGADQLQDQIRTAVEEAIGDPAISGELDVFLEGGRIGFRPDVGASLVSAVSMPMVGNETLGFDGQRLVVPTAILDSGVLGHDLEFTINVGDDDERVIIVTPDATNTSVEHLINDINAELRDQGLRDISVALDAGSTRELAFSVADGSNIGAAVLVGVRNPSTLADGLSLGLQVANFPSAQDLADKLSEILSGIVGGVTVNFDTIEREMSLTVNLSRDFDIAALPIDLSVDLGEFIELASSADLEVTANAGLTFTFGVDLEPSESLVVAPPVSVPTLPDDGQLSDTATFDFTLFQQNFEPEERLSDDGDPDTVGALNVSGWSVIANTASTPVTWTAPDDMTPSDGRMVDGLLPDGNENLLPDQHFFIRVTNNVGVETLVDGVLQSFDTLDNTSAANLAEDLEGAMIVALASRGFAGLQVAITNVTDSGFDIAAAGAGFDNYQLELVTEDEFEIADVTNVTVAPDTINNSSVSDLIEDVQNAIDNQSAMQLQRLDDTALGLSESIPLTNGGDPVIGSVPVAENGVLERDVHFEVVIGGTTYRGVVAAGDTIDNEQENYAADEANRQGDPVAALAQDVEESINIAIAPSGATVTVDAHPPLGQDVIDLSTSMSSDTTDSPVVSSGVLDQDVAFVLTVGAQEISGSLAFPDTQDNDDAVDLASDVEAAINDAMENAGLDTRIIVAADVDGFLTFTHVAGAGVEIDFSDTPFRRLEYSVVGATIDELHFVTPAVLAEFTGNRVSLFAAPVLVQPDTDNPGRLLARRIEISADAGDTAFTELGLLSSPIPSNGQLSADAEFVIIVDGNETTVTVYDDNNVANSNASNTSDNSSVEDLIADINVALATERGDANVQVRRVMFGDTTMSGGNRIEFFTEDMSMIRSLTLPALQGSGDPMNPNAQDIAINELGFSPDDDHSARIQSGEFFVEDVALTGRLDILANDIEASAIVGFGGDGGLGLGVEVVESMGGIFGNAMIGLVNPDTMAPVADATRISLGTLWEYISGDATQPLTDLVDASITGGVDIDLSVAPVLPIRTPIEPANIAIDLEITDWLGQPPSLDDASDPNGISVNISGLDLNIYDALSNLTFSDVVDALQEVLQFLRDLQGDGDSGNGAIAAILDEPLPLLNQSPSDLLIVADHFATLVDEVIANPSDSLDKLETMLEDLLGLPEELVTLGLDFDDGLALRVDLVFKAGVEESLGFDLDIEDLVDLTDPNSPARGLLEGITGLVGVSSTGDLSVGVGGTVRLSFGIELGSGNGSAEALGFKDGAMSENGILTATSDAQAAAERLVDQTIEFILDVDGTSYTVEVIASETDDTVEVDGTTLLSELKDAPELRAGVDIRVTLLDGSSVDIDLNPGGIDPMISEVVDAINGTTGLNAQFNDITNRIEITDASNAAAGSEQSGVYVTQTDVVEFSALQFSLQVGLNRAAVPVTVDAMTGVTRKQWLAAIDEAIRKAMVDAGQLNPVADAVVDVAYNGVIRQLTFQGTGEGFGERLTITRGGVFSISDISPSAIDSSNAADKLGIDGADSDGNRTIIGKELRTDDPADPDGLAEDVQQAVRTAMNDMGNPPIVEVVLMDPDPTDNNVGRLEFRTDPASVLTISSVSQTFAPFLYNGVDGTAFIIEAGASGENLEFTAQVGPFGFFVIDGTANLDAFFQIVLDDTGDTPERMMDGRTYFGQDDFDISTDYGGSASAELPLYFPTESRPVNEEDNTLDILVPNLLGFFNGDGGSVEITTPDLTAFPTPTLIGMLSNPEFIIDGLDSILLSIQDALDGEIYGIDLPLIGDGLAPAGQFISDFREDVLAYLSLKLREGGLNPVTLVRETLYNIFGDEDDGDPAAVQVLGFEPGDDDNGTGTLQSGTLTSGALARDAELNITVGDEDKTRVVVIADNIEGDTPEALVEAFNNALRGRGLDDSLTAGFVEDGTGGFFLTLDATNDESILIETAGAIPLDLFGLSVGGLGFLQDAEGVAGGTVDIEDIVKSGFGLFDEFGQFDFLLGQDYVFGQSLDFDLGLPILDFDLDAGIEIDFGWDLAFGFGVSQQDGFYFVAGDDGDPATPDLLPDNDEELIIQVDVNLLGALGFSPGRATGDDFDEDPNVMTATG